MILLLFALAQPMPAAAEPVGAAASSAVAPDLVAPYDAIRLALVNDKLDVVQSAAREFGSAAAGDAALAAAASAVAASPDLLSARTGFGELSRLLVIRLAATKPTAKVLVYHCPMFAGFPWWIQSKSGIANPYMGQAMPECGEEISLKAAVKAATVP